MCHTWIQILNGFLLDRVDLDLSRLMNISSTSVLSLKKNLLLLSISWQILQWHLWSLLPLRYVSKYDCVGGNRVLTFSLGLRAALLGACLIPGSSIFGAEGTRFR